MVKFDPQKHHRCSIHLNGFDYSQEGAYFVTVVARHRICLFGKVTDRAIVLNEFGKIVAQKWQWLETQYDYIELGAWVVMPNHFHGILAIHENGVQHQVCKSHVVRNTDALIEQLQANLAHDTNSSLERVMHFGKMLEFWSKIRQKSPLLTLHFKNFIEPIDKKFARQTGHLENESQARATSFGDDHSGFFGEHRRM